MRTKNITDKQKHEVENSDRQFIPTMCDRNKQRSSNEVYLQLQQLRIGSFCQAIWQKEMREEEHGDSYPRQSHGENVDS